jgi:hypothetical protein
MGAVGVIRRAIRTGDERTPIGQFAFGSERDLSGGSALGRHEMSVVSAPMERLGA